MSLGLGRTFSWWGWRQGAVTALHDALRSDPGCAPAHFCLGEILARERRWEDSASAFAEAARLDPSNLEARGNVALGWARAGRWSAAGDTLAEMLRLRPRQAELHLLRGAVLARARRPDEAIRSFRHAIGLASLPDGARFFLGEAILGVERWRDIVRTLRAARALGVPAASPGAGRRRSGRVPIVSVLGALSMVPVAAAESHAAVREARVCFSIGPGEAGLEPCRRALALDLSAEHRPAVEVTLASRLAALGRWSEVIEVYRDGARRRPADGLAQLRLGTVLLHATREDGDPSAANRDDGGRSVAEAETVLRQAVRLRAEDPEAHGQLALAAAAQGRPADAVRSFEDALRLDPKYFEHRPAAQAAYESALRGEAWPLPEK